MSDAECREVIAELPFSEAGVIEIQMALPVDPYLEIYPYPEGE
jgi:hypothetical protein